MEDIQALERLLFENEYRIGSKNLYYAEKDRCKCNPFIKALQIIEKIKENNNGTIHIITGFPISCSSFGETDGPLGAIILAEMFYDLKMKPIIISDKYMIQPIKKIIDHIKLEIELYDQYSWTYDTAVLFVTIETPGHAIDNKYYSMKGLEINYAAKFDLIVEKMLHKIPIISIGDGGNEIGMGNIYDAVIKHVPQGLKIASVVKSDILIVSQISNWGAYLLDHIVRSHFSLTKKHTPEREEKFLKILNSAGVVDGVTCLREPTVDGINIEIHKEFIRNLNKMRIMK